jgi:hypothetical protein
VESGTLHRRADGSHAGSRRLILVDTNVLVDIWTRDPTWGDWSSEALAKAVDRELLAVNLVIVAELSLGFDSEYELERLLEEAGIRWLPIPRAAAWVAARAFGEYRRRGGQRASTLPDFFIGGHAEVAGLRLLSRDARRYRTYFPDVDLIAPDAA